MEAASAILSPCGFYLYRLERRWGQGPTACFLMLNPSTADASVDDATIRRVRGFSKREGCGGLIVANLFAWRATDPSELSHAADPVGPENEDAILAAVAVARRSAGPVIAAWGGHKMAVSRAAALSLPDIEIHCLGLTKAGAPRQALCVRQDAPLAQFLLPGL